MRSVSSPAWTCAASIKVLPHRAPSTSGATAHPRCVTSLPRRRPPRSRLPPTRPGRTGQVLHPPRSGQDCTVAALCAGQPPFVYGGAADGCGIRGGTRWTLASSTSCAEVAGWPGARQARCRVVSLWDCRWNSRHTPAGMEWAKPPSTPDAAPQCNDSGPRRQCARGRMGSAVPGQDAVGRHVSVSARICAPPSAVIRWNTVLRGQQRG
jgi:hypothetical protein